MGLEITRHVFGDRQMSEAVSAVNVSRICIVGEAQLDLAQPRPFPPLSHPNGCHPPTSNMFSVLFAPSSRRRSFVAENHLSGGVGAGGACLECSRERSGRGYKTGFSLLTIPKIATQATRTPTRSYTTPVRRVLSLLNHRASRPKLAETTQTTQSCVHSYST